MIPVYHMEKPRPRQQEIHATKEKLPPVRPMSEQLVTASLDVATTLQEGKKPTDSQINALADATVNEFSKDGPSITTDQQTSFKKAAKEALTIQDSARESDIGAPKINLKDYQDTFNYVYKQYGLDKHAVKLGILESMMMTNAVLTKLTPPFISKNLPDLILSEKSMQMLRVAEDWKKMPKDRQIALLKIAGKMTFPIWGPIAGLLSSTVLDGAARKAYEKETLFMREAINSRVANSVFMRDFEFVQDKSPAEILNIIDKGKQGTMDLINTTYTEVIPHLTSMVAATSSGFAINKLGGVLGLLRLPILYTSNRKLMEKVIGERQVELAQKDAVDTRIMTSLQSIEVVKSSDTMENAISELGKTMQERDEIAIESRKRHAEQKQRGSYLDLLFQFGLPAGLGALEWQKQKGGPMGDAYAGMQAFSKFSAVSAGQSEAGVHATELVRLYSEKIQPALQDIKRMEDLLGPYDLLDKPDGMLEQVRKPVSEITNFDITVRNLSFKNILHNVSIDIPQGTFVTIKGPSGIGKTTFLRHLVGFYGAQKGALQYGGTDLNGIKKFGEQSVYSKLAYANQNPQYFENMTLRENLQLWTKKQATNEKLAEVLHDLKLDHITDRMDSKVKHFSGGELRRIGLARALLKDPKVLFLDEPTSNLDEESARQVLSIIKDMRAKRPDMTVIAVTHDPNFEAIAEKIVDFAQINRPENARAESLGNRQVFYAASASPSKN